MTGPNEIQPPKRKFDEIQGDMPDARRQRVEALDLESPLVEALYHHMEPETLSVFVRSAVVGPQIIESISAIRSGDFNKPLRAILANCECQSLEEAYQKLSFGDLLVPDTKHELEGELAKFFVFIQKGYEWYLEKMSEDATVLSFDAFFEKVIIDHMAATAQIQDHIQHIENTQNQTNQKDDEDDEDFDDEDMDYTGADYDLRRRLRRDYHFKDKFLTCLPRNMSQIPEYVGDLILSNTYLTVYPKIIQEMCELVNLSIQGTGISELPEGFVYGVLSDLESIDVSQTRIKSIPVIHAFSQDRRTVGHLEISPSQTLPFETLAELYQVFVRSGETEASIGF